MANSEAVDLMAVGKHCSKKDCNRLDFLPFKCDKCHEIFCVDHRGEGDHACPNTDMGDVRVPICPLCHQMVVRKQGQSPNDQVEKHLLSGCTDLVVTRQKSKANRCTYRDCRRRELIPFMCTHCENVFCIRHRHAIDHECQSAIVHMQQRTVVVH